MLPERFSELTELVIRDWDWDELPTSIDDIWDSLMTQIFLGPTVRTSQATFIKELLDPLICYSSAPDVGQTGWSKTVLTYLYDMQNSVINTPNESQKQAIITLTLQDVDDLTLSRTIHKSLLFFSKNRISVRKILQLKDEARETENLAVSASQNIYNVGLTKAILWFYGCGIAKELVPPNSHVVNFLNQNSYLDLGWDYTKWPPPLHLLSKCRNKAKEISDTVSQTLGQGVSPKQVQAAIWYLQTCRGLLPKSRRGKISPGKLIDFLEYQNWTINNLEHHITEIELLEDLETSLNSFLG